LRRFHMPRTAFNACRLVEARRLCDVDSARSSRAGNRMMTVPLRTETLTTGSFILEFYGVFEPSQTAGRGVVTFCDNLGVCLAVGQRLPKTPRKTGDRQTEKMGTVPRSSSSNSLRYSPHFQSPFSARAPVGSWGDRLAVVDQSPFQAILTVRLTRTNGYLSAIDGVRPLEAVIVVGSVVLSGDWRLAWRLRFA
jgi:hypothetical protein